jgi:rubrerythrin
MQSDALAKAVTFEKGIATFYLDKGKDASNPLVQKLFLTLAQQEIDHMLYIFQASRAADAGAGDAGRPVVIEEEMKGFFRRLPRGGFKKDAGQIPAIEAAMKLEEKGYAMYQEFLAASTADADKKFYALLLEQEKKHLESLQNIHFYLAGTGDWFEGEESKQWNWMNI